MNIRVKKMAVPVMAVVFGFLAGTVILLFSGRSPLIMFNVFIKGLSGIDFSHMSFNPRYLGEFFVQLIPITLAGLSVGFAFRTGLFNIGAEGQFMMGAMGATMVALMVKAPFFVHAILCLAGAALMGAIWGAIPGFLKAKFNVHEVVVTIMFNYIALYVSNWVLLNIVKTLDKVKTAPFPETALLKSEFLSNITRFSRLNWGIIIVLVAVLLYWFLIEKTSFGFGLRAVGFNSHAARHAGMPVERNMVLSMAISGAFAALGGAAVAMGTFGFGRVLSAFEGYGFDGIAVALVGGNSAAGILASGGLFAMLKASQPLLQSQGVPREVVGIIQALIVMFVAMKLGIEYVLDRLGRRENASSAEEDTKKEDNSLHDTEELKKTETEK
ncbi:ABC transporter permease [Spirochaetia bacterium 38H-sp]|uniref:ABC transporter permease n=1 Tax=Rarispira pelagica TaxID=3141764 RepID=A0ABU9UE49_9SPIR